MQTLKTSRLLLRPVEEGDGPALHRLWTDPEVRRYLWDGRIISLETVSAILAASQVCFQRLGVGFYTLTPTADPQTLLGFCGLREFEDGQQIEMLYGMFPEFWGSGLITEAAAAVLGHGFERCGLPAVIGATDTPNQRSVRVMQRLGMVFLERREWHGLDTVFYGLSRQQYLKRA